MGGGIPPKVNDFTQYDLELVEQDDDFIGIDLVSLWRTCAEYVEFFRFLRVGLRQ